MRGTWGAAPAPVALPQDIFASMKAAGGAGL